MFVGYDRAIDGKHISANIKIKNAKLWTKLNWF